MSSSEGPLLITVVPPNPSKTPLKSIPGWLVFIPGPPQSSIQILIRSEPFSSDPSPENISPKKSTILPINSLNPSRNPPPPPPLKSKQSPHQDLH